MISEDLIREATQEYEHVLDAQLPKVEAHRFSSRFSRKMKARFSQAEYGKTWLIVRRIACVLLVALLCGCALMAAPSVRAAFARWFCYHWPDGGSLYYASETGQAAQNGAYGMGWVPDGFTLDEHYEISNTVRYLTEDRDMILLQWMSPSQGGIAIDKWSEEEHQILLHGRPADVYLNSQPLQECSIVWVSEDGNTLFILTVNCDEETAIRVAESIYKVQ